MHPSSRLVVLTMSPDSCYLGSSALFFFLIEMLLVGGQAFVSRARHGLKEAVNGRLAATAYCILFGNTEEIYGGEGGGGEGQDRESDGV